MSAVNEQEHYQGMEQRSRFLDIQNVISEERDMAGRVSLAVLGVLDSLENQEAYELSDERLKKIIYKSLDQYRPYFENRGKGFGS